MYIIVAFCFFIRICCSWIWFLLCLILGGENGFWKRERGLKSIFHLASYPRTRKSSILIVWLRNKENQKLKSPETSDWNNALPAKKVMITKASVEKNLNRKNFLQLSHTNTEKIFHLKFRSVTHRLTFKKAI